MNKIEIFYDTNPRDDYNLTTMVCNHKRYKLGDVHEFEAFYANSWKEYFAEYFLNYHYDIIYKFNNFSDNEKAKKILEYWNNECLEFSNELTDVVWEFIENVVIYNNLYLYDHSGVIISINPFGCKWDSGQIGFIYVIKDDFIKETNISDVEKIKEWIKEDVDIYNHYLQGNTYLIYLFENDEEIDVISYYGILDEFYSQNKYLLNEDFTEELFNEAILEFNKRGYN